MRICLILLLIVFCFSGCSLTSYQPAGGDILFQDLASAQSQAVKLATHSEYTHCGIVFEVDGQFVVYEAVGPVRAVPLDQWIAQGVDGRAVAMRLDTLYGYLTPRAVSASNNNFSSIRMREHNTPTRIPTPILPSPLPPPELVRTREDLR